ncbi:DUF397 domain-containing protein [Saccharothrix sp. HUAS TT1]|uniref:DUF397 domain-containing protein n=1 Tax=unclassified Saccharothrix TaxID=2593673 RepID=UPI00345B4E80
MPSPTGWFKSSYSGGADDNCVEVRFTDDVVGVRDSKNTEAALAISQSGWQAFIAGLAR